MRKRQAIFVFHLLLCLNFTLSTMAQGLVSFDQYLQKSVQNESKNIDSSIHFAQKAIEATNNDEEKAEAFYQLGHAQKVKGIYGSAIENGYRALNLFEVQNKTEGIIKTKLLLGACFALKREYTSSKNYFLSVIDLSQENSESKVLAYVGLGNVYYYTDFLKEAENAYQEAIQIGKDSEQTSAKTTAGIFINLGNINVIQQEYESARDYYEQALKIYESTNNKFGICVTLYNIGDVFYFLEDNENARKYFFQSLNLGKEINSVDDISYSLKSISDTYRNEKNFEKALEFSDKYHAFIDSIATIEKTELVKELEIEYQKEMQDSTIRVQDEKINLANTQLVEQELSKRALTIGIIGLGAIALLAVFAYFNIRRKNYIIEIAKKEIDKNLKDKEILLKEIHHRVKNNLQMISSLLNLQTYTLSNKDAINALEESKNRVQAIALVHKKLYQDVAISTVKLDEYVLDLTQWMKQFNTPDFQLDYVLYIEDIDLNLDTIVPLGLIICELISNSQKHAFDGIKNPTIDLNIKRLNQGKMCLYYQDNGNGFKDDFSIENNNSLGFEIIESLTEQLNGEMTIGSKHGMFMELIFTRI